MKVGLVSALEPECLRGRNELPNGQRSFNIQQNVICFKQHCTNHSAMHLDTPILLTAVHFWQIW